MDKRLEEAIDEGLNVLGKSGKQMLFYHLETRHSLKRQEITKKPDVFAEAIQEIFGAGASVLEKLIVKNVYSKLGLKYQERNKYTFSDYLRDIAITLEQETTDTDKEGENAYERLPVTY